MERLLPLLCIFFSCSCENQFESGGFKLDNFDYNHVEAMDTQLSDIYLEFYGFPTKNIEKDTCIIAINNSIVYEGKIDNRLLEIKIPSSFYEKYIYPEFFYKSKNGVFVFAPKESAFLSRSDNVIFLILDFNKEYSERFRGVPARVGGY